jgi:hypothetical protein
VGDSGKLEDIDYFSNAWVEDGYTSIDKASVDIEPVSKAPV